MVAVVMGSPEAFCSAVRAAETMPPMSVTSFSAVSTGTPTAGSTSSMVARIVPATPCTAATSAAMLEVFTVLKRLPLSSAQHTPMGWCRAF